MLRTVDSLSGYTIHATDAELGKVEDVYFDDQKWGVRYLVVETGSWLSKRTVLISPYSITGVDDANKAINVSLTREQVRNSPSIDTYQPISRRMELQHTSYYGYGNYWTGPHLWGVAGSPVYPMGEGMPEPTPSELEQNKAQDVAGSDDVHLRSCDGVGGYYIMGTNGELGHVKDFMVDDKDWAIRYLLVDTRNWWPGGKKVLLATHWVERIDWPESRVHVKLTRQQIKDSPEYDEDQPIDRDYEERLHEHYDRTGYWDE